MELSAKYAYKIYEKGSFSAAAKALYISQPALSTMIAKLEKKLDFKIFDRTSTPLKLTVKGQIYIDALEEIRECEYNMNKRLEQLAPKQQKQLRIGTSIYLSDRVMPEVCRRFGSLHPDVSVKLDMGSKGSNFVLHDRLINNHLDLLIDYNHHKDKHEAKPILEMRDLIAVRGDLPEIEKLLPYAISRTDVLRGEYPKMIEKNDVELFNDVPFVTTDTTTGYTKRIIELLGNNYSLARFSVNNIRNLGMYYEMMRAGLGATVAMDIHLLASVFNDDNIVYFAIKNTNAKKTLKAIWRKDEKLSPEMLEFLEIFSSVLSEIRTQAINNFRP